MAKQKKKEITLDVILAHLRDHLNELRPVTLYNTFNGIPITYEAEVAMIHPDFIGLIVHPYQAVCIKQERRTYIESKSLPTLVRAYPVSIDYTNNVVLFKNLKVPKSISVDLYNSWVSPEKPVTVEMDSDIAEPLSAQLLEIAVLDNNSIRVVVAVPEDTPYERKDEASMAFRLEPGGDVIQVQGLVHSLIKIRNKKMKRLEVDGNATMGDEITILANIAKREDQIMNDLDKAYKKLRKGKKLRKR